MKTLQRMVQSVRSSNYRLSILAIPSLIVVLGFAVLADGDLDTSFNSVGYVVLNPSTNNDFCNAVAVQSDGKIIAAGLDVGGGFFVSRFTSSGVLDNTFDTDGKVSGSALDGIYAIALQPDGKIVCVGYKGSIAVDLGVLRLNTNGSPDATFDTDGVVTTDIAAGDYAYAVAIQGDGKIVVAGVSENDFFVARYTTTGALDNSFDTDGIATLNIFGVDIAYGVAIQSDGKIVVAGVSDESGATRRMTVVRYTSVGILDASFDTDGIVTALVGGPSAWEYGSAVAIDANGKIVVAGMSWDSNFDFAIARYNDNGSFDNTFNSTGRVVTPIGTGHDYGRALIIQADGKILVAGYSHNGTNKDVAVVRYTSSGSLDGTFGSGGKITTPVAGDDDGLAIALQSDGKIVVGGESHNGTDRDFTVLRYSGSSGPLPVELSRFSVTTLASTPTLLWRTETELNNYGFEIERRSMGEQAWVKVGFVASSGTSSLRHEYSFVDRQVSAGNYSYRIKQIDKDGSFKYTGEVEVQVGVAPREFTLVQNYPNPFNPSTTIEFSLPVDGRAVLKVIDMLGREVATLFDGEAKAGYYNRIVFDASHLASGTYFTRLEAGGKQILKKMVLMK